MGNSNVTIGSAVWTLVMGVLNKLSPDQWLALGVFIGIVCTVLSLIVNSWVKLAMRADARQAEARRYELLASCLKNDAPSSVRFLAEGDKSP